MTVRIVESLPPTEHVSGNLVGYSLIVPVAPDDDPQPLIDSWSSARSGAPGGESVVVPFADAELGTYAAAANAGARRAQGSVLVFVRDAVPMADDALRALLAAFEIAEIGGAGGTIHGPDGTRPEMGLALWPARLSLLGFAVYRPARQADPHTGVADCDAVSSTVLATRREVFLELGGFDEQLGDAYADLDYCLRVRERGRRIVVNPNAAFKRTRGPEPAAAGGHRAFALRWRERYVPRANLHCERSGFIAREESSRSGLRLVWAPLPATRVVVHGPAPADPEGFAASLRRSRLAPNEILWSADPAADARAATESRGEGYVAFVRTDTALAPDWLNVLVDTIEYAGNCVAATAVDPDVTAIDGRCTLVAPRLVPQHLRLRADLPLEDALAEWIARAVAGGRSVRGVRGEVATLGEPRSRPPAATAPAAPRDEFATIALLNWNTAPFTELAVASIRAHTRLPHEIVIVDNGSRPEDANRLRNLGVRVIGNPQNTGFAYGTNQGLAAARGTHVVILNNDVIVTGGWLEAMIDVQRRRPTIGVSAPRSNAIVGDQKIENVPYQTIPALHAFAARRAIEQRGAFYLAERAVGFCLCIDRRVIDEIGGFDPRYGLGNFEDDDFCIRVRAAGYEIAICEDAFVHHFGEASFQANNLDYRTLMAANRTAFLRRWDLAAADAEGGSWDALPAIRRGYSRERDFVPLPPPEPVGAGWRLGTWQ